MARKTYGRLTSGFAELDQKLAELKTGLNNTIIRKGQREQCKVLAQAMKNSAPNKVTKRSIGYRVGFKSGRHQAKVGINVGKKKIDLAELARAGKRAPLKALNPLAPLFVIGTKPRTRKSGGSTGRMSPHASFVKAATSAASGTASDALKSVVSTELKKIWDSK